MRTAWSNAWETFSFLYYFFIKKLIIFINPMSNMAKKVKLIPKINI